MDTSDNLANMKPCEYNNILTGLIAEIAGLKERRPSAGRLKYLEGDPVAPAHRTAEGQC